MSIFTGIELLVTLELMSDSFIYTHQI